MEITKRRPKHFYAPTKTKTSEAITAVTSNFVVICEIPSRKNPYWLKFVIAIVDVEVVEPKFGEVSVHTERKNGITTKIASAWTFPDCPNIPVEKNSKVKIMKMSCRSFDEIAAHDF